MRMASYTGSACPDLKKDGVCVRGELCPYAHNVFEYWLHPTRCALYTWEGLHGRLTIAT